MIFAALVTTTTAPTAPVPYGNGLSTSVFGGVLAGLLTAAVLGAIAWVVKESRKRTAENVTRNAERDQKIADVQSTMDEIRGALITPSPTPLNPDPKPALVEVVMGKDGKGGLVDTVAKHGLLLASLIKDGDTTEEARRVADELETSAHKVT